MNKKTELFMLDNQASVCIESNSVDDTVIFSVTEYEVDESKSTPDNTSLKAASTTEIYIGQEDALEVAKALIETLDGEEGF